MLGLMNKVKRLSPPMFVIFVLSKLIVGVGLGILLIQYLAPYGWWFLIVGIILSVFCVVKALQK